MTKTIQIIFLFLFLISCSDKNIQKAEVDNLNFVDTSIIFKSNKQNIKLWFDKHGNIDLISLLADENAENIFLTESGKINQIQATKLDDIELTYDFYSDGQIKKIKWNDLEKPFVNDQDIEFSKSFSKSLMVNENSSHFPLVSGHKDTFDINTNFLITFKDVFESGPTKYEIESIISQAPNLMTEINSDKSGVNVRADKSGTYRLVAKIRTTFLSKPKEKNWTKEGTFFKLDLDLTFK
jgi:hypothetical protein